MPDRASEKDYGAGGPAVQSLRKKIGFDVAAPGAKPRRALTSNHELVMQPRGGTACRARTRLHATASGGTLRAQGRTARETPVRSLR